MHAQVEGEGGWEQGHRWDASKLCIDPYAPLIEGRKRFAVRDDTEQFRLKASVTLCAPSCKQSTALSGARHELAAEQHRAPSGQAKHCH